MISNDYVLKANNLSKSVKLGNNNHLLILKNINLTVQKGEFLSILGPSGSGKSTLLNCLSGLDELSSGTVEILGQSISKLSSRKMAKLRKQDISFIFQSYNLIPALPAMDNIILPLRLSKRSVDEKAIKNLMDKMNFKANLNNFPEQLSGGEQQKIAIARALVMKSRIVFADEPTGALDSVSRQLIFQQLQSLADQGVCVIMVTHDIELAAQTKRALILRDGVIERELEFPTASELFKTINEPKAVMSNA